MIGANANEIAIVNNTTSGILLAANGIDFKDGDNVIIPEKEFPANVYPWLNLKRKGVDVRFVKWSAGRVLIKDILGLIDSRTRLVSISHVQFTNGFRVNLEELGRELQKRGALFFVDAIQSMGVFDIDVKRDNIDFLAADSHKWLLGPEGVGFFYCKSDNLDILNVTNLGYTSVVNSDDYLDYGMTLKPDASRFEEGSMNMLGIHAVRGSLRLQKEVTQSKVRSAVLELTDYLADNLRRIGCSIISPRRDDGEKSGIVSFVPKDRETKRLYAKLIGNNCNVAHRDNAIRLSPHFYNTISECDRLMSLL